MHAYHVTRFNEDGLESYLHSRFTSPPSFTTRIGIDRAVTVTTGGSVSNFKMNSYLQYTKISTVLLTHDLQQQCVMQRIITIVSHHHIIGIATKRHTILETCRNKAQQTRCCECLVTAQILPKYLEIFFLKRINNNLRFIKKSSFFLNLWWTRGQ